MNKDPLMLAHMHSTCNKEEIENSTICYCFYCCGSFSPDKIKEWIKENKLIGETAICPNCGIDAVLSDNCGLTITDEFLKQLHEYWFDGPGL